MKMYEVKGNMRKTKRIVALLLVCGMVLTCMPQQAKALDILGILDKNKEKESTPILLGNTYTYDYNGNNGAGLKLSEVKKEFYFKLQVTENSNYTYKFKVASADGVYVKLYDENYKQIGGSTYDIKNLTGDSLKTVSDTLGLNIGTYYIGVKLTSTDSAGSIYLGKYDGLYQDPQYNESEQIHENTSNAVEGAKVIYRAPRIALGQTYSYDWSNSKKANLSIPVEDAYCFYKFIITEKANYTYKFKVSTPEEALIKLYDADYNPIGGSPYENTPDKLTTLSNTLSLQPGAYYVGICLKNRNAAGNLYLAKMNSTYADPQYQPSELVNGTKVKNFAGADNYQAAPRIALGQTYSFDCNNLKEANLSIPDIDKLYFYKVLITEKGNYAYTFKVATRTGALVKLYDGDYKCIGGSPYERVFDSEKTLSDVVSLTPGVYYIGISLEGRDAEGSICLAKKLIKQTITVSKKASKTVTLKAATLKKIGTTFNINAKAPGKITYKVKSGAAKYVKVSNAGKVTMKKGAKKGTYVIQVIAAKTGNYAKTTKKIKIVVK